MDALVRVGEHLSWAAGVAPRGELVLLRDSVDAGGAFLVHHFIALFAKAGHRVVLANFAQSREHYAAVVRKLGVNLRSLEDQQRLRVLDFFSDPDRLENTSLVELFDEIHAGAASSAQREPVSIVIDDLSALRWRFGAHKVVQFLRCCKTLTREANGAMNVVALTHTDTETPEPVASHPLAMNAALLDVATVSFTVTPLASGYSRDVHGTLSVLRHCPGRCNELPAPAEVAFKVLDSTIKCFPKRAKA